MTLPPGDPQNPSPDASDSAAIDAAIAGLDGFGAHESADAPHTTAASLDAANQTSAAPPKIGTVAPGPLTVSSAGAREQQLSKVPLFGGLTEDALARIAAISHEESHATGTRIFQYGDPGDKLFVLLEGKVRISREISGMGEEALAVLGPGEVFGEMALFDESPRSADARAHERCRLLVIEKEAFDDLLFIEKDLAYEVLWSCVRILASRMRETNDKLAFLSTSSRF